MLFSDKPYMCLIGKDFNNREALKKAIEISYSKEKRFKYSGPIIVGQLKTYAWKRMQGIRWI